MSTVNFHGNPVRLNGTLPKVGAKSPDFQLTSGALADVSLKDFAGKRKVLNIVPSLDTPTCATSTRKFNELAAQLPNTAILAVSADLPFAQARWCGAAGIKNVSTLSDHAQMALADALGIHVKELRLFARTVFVVDSSGKIVYREIVPEITSEPNYEAALTAVTSAS